MRSAWTGLAAIALGAACATQAAAPVTLAPIPHASAASIEKLAPQPPEAPATPVVATPPAPMPPPVTEPGPQTFKVMLAPGNDPKSGRLIVIATPVSYFEPDYSGPGTWSLSATEKSFIAAQEAPWVTPARPVRFDADLLADPRPLSRIDPGEYWVQVRLDTNHNAAYAQLDADADYVSAPVKMTLPSPAPVDVTLRLERDVYADQMKVPAAETKPQTALPPDVQAKADRANEDMRAAMAEADAHMKPLDFVSPALSAFWGRPMHIRGLVLLPPDYDRSKTTYPTVYRAEGFGANLSVLNFPAQSHYNLMKSGQTPPMIRVFLDHSSPWGTTEFADSVNNGPWGKALTEELIPWLEKQYRMDAKPSGRFTTGHSSGGWFAIWQQVRYPKIFGGSWARSPDPVDFRAFTGFDPYSDTNAYTRTDGSPRPLVRDETGRDIQSVQEYARQEKVLGDYGGQYASFDWVFSPKGDDGRPQPLFDRVTGKIDPAVATYWRDHFDISYIIRRDWPTLKPVLNGKIHVTVGDNDTFHLNEAVHLLQDELNKLGAKASFTYVPGGTHFNIDRIGEDACGLEKKIALEMWQVARPGSAFKPAAAATRDAGLGMPAC